MRQARIGFALLPLGLGAAYAQLDEPATTCAPLSYVLKVQLDTFAAMKLSTGLNGAKGITVDTAKYSDPQKLDVTRLVKPTGNTLNVAWQVTGDANRPAARTAWVSLKVGSGTRFTTVAAFRTDYYPGQKSLKFRFDAPPKASVRCDPNAPAYQLHLGTAVGDGRVTQFTLSVNGQYYAITNNEPANLTESQTLDLRPYLTRGKNDVKVQWTVLREQRGISTYGAQITRVEGGRSTLLAQTVVTAHQGESGSFGTVITVP